MILSIIGGTQATIIVTGLKITTLTKVGILLYIAGFIVTIGVFVVATTHLFTVPKSERWLAITAGIALTFIAVRLVFSVLSAFLHSVTFSMVGDEVVVYIGMALVQEFVVIIIYEVLR